MPTPNHKTALITGASFGIGFELARIFAREGHNLVLVARSADKLRQLASELEKAHGTRSLILAVDLTDPGASAYVLDQTTRAGFRSTYWSITLGSDSMVICGERSGRMSAPDSTQHNHSHSSDAALSTWHD